MNIPSYPLYAACSFSALPFETLSRRVPASELEFHFIEAEAASDRFPMGWKGCNVEVERGAYRHHGMRTSGRGNSQRSMKRRGVSFVARMRNDVHTSDISQ